MDPPFQSPNPKPQGNSPSPPLPPNGITTTISSNAPKRASSGSSFWRLPFIRSSPDHRPSKQPEEDASRRLKSPSSFPSLRSSTPESPQQPTTQKTRRRRGSLRKVAMLGRSLSKRPSSIDSSGPRPVTAGPSTSPPTTSEATPIPALVATEVPIHGSDKPSGLAPGLEIQYTEPLRNLDGADDRARHGSLSATMPYGAPVEGSLPPPAPSVPPPAPPALDAPDPTTSSPSMSFSTTDEDDGLHMRKSPEPAEPQELLQRPTAEQRASSSYFSRHDDAPDLRKRSIYRSHSPVALTSLPPASPPPTIPEEDEEVFSYDTTEFFGWVILVVTLLTFVVGMGSVLGIWQWSWDVGATPNAPPELEDDESLPISGYYPALMIMTCVMAWVWVFVAWLGMKLYSRAKTDDFSDN